MSPLFRRLLARRRAQIALGLVVAYALTALVGPFIVGSDGLALDLSKDLAPPSEDAWLGYAENGVDVFTVLVFGARISLIVALSATLISTVVGVIVGGASAVAGGRIDALALRILDILQAFPGILLAVYLAAVLPPSTMTVIVALCATGWVGYARVARTSVQAILAREHVTAARALGASGARVVMRHVLPLVGGPIVIQASFGLSTTILAEAALAFLGLGAPPGTPSWGALLDEGVAYLFVAPHLAIAPGACIAGAVLAFNILGDALRDALDVRSKA